MRINADVVGCDEPASGSSVHPSEDRNGVTQIDLKILKVGFQESSQLKLSYVVRRASA